MNHRYTDSDVLRLARELSARLPDSDIVQLARSARDALGPEAGPMALSLARLWEKHRAKFPSWPEFVGDRTALEQASGEYAATWRAKRFTGLCVLDLCCGAGGDTVALSRVAAEVIAVDRDPDRLDWARHNVERYGLPDRVSFLCADCSDPLPEADAAVLDPDRRAGSTSRGYATRGHATRVYAGRAIRPEDYSPPLGVWEQIRRSVRTLGVKVAPGIPYESIPDDAVAEFIESRGECREAVLWFGDSGPSTRQAVMLPSEDVISADEPEEATIGGIGEAIYDPSPATVRAHLITHLAAQLGARRIDAQIAYLTSDSPPQATPFAAAFSVEVVVPWSLKRVQAQLSSRDIGALEIRARRFPVRPDDLRKRLNLKGPIQRTLICTRIGGDPVAIIAKRAQ